MELKEKRTGFPIDTGNRFGAGAALGVAWLVSPPEPGEPLERCEVLNLLAALSIVIGADADEIEAAKRALREGPDTGVKTRADRGVERDGWRGRPRPIDGSCEIGGDANRA